MDTHKVDQDTNECIGYDFKHIFDESEQITENEYQCDFWQVLSQGEAKISNQKMICLSMLTIYLYVFSKCKSVK